MAAMSVRCCVAGGGPAGMMLGLLLARTGVEVLVLEKHADFLRDFRGDTIHPSTLEVLHELGMLDAFLRRPHQELHKVGAQIADAAVTVGDFSHLPTRCRFIALMPQWDFLDFLAEQATPLPGFRLMRQAEVTGLIEEAGRVAGLHVTTPEGVLEVRASLVVGADGRHSTVRRAAGLEVMNIGAPIDVLWMRISRLPADPVQSLGRIAGGRMMVTIDRGDYWQCAFVIRKGGFDVIRAQGLDAFRAQVAALAPYMHDRLGELAGWDDVKLLTVSVDRLRRWHRPGLLCIGDAAHAMSPIGGVGINLAIQDAVAAANILATALSGGGADDALLAEVQRRRSFPTMMTQRVQVFLQDRIFRRVLAGGGGGGGGGALPLLFRLLRDFPVLRRIPARIVGMGFRPEHVQISARAGSVLHDPLASP
ncbi:MAG TPA: FAD-dependent oxidoreductase [Acetobacteraceae bacterium]|jgi:2-polyprenyl-6-methoxyphenol hydroxylase-like FAD-dependent oxidoreductase